MMTPTARWELGLDDIAGEYDAQFGAENRDDLDAINSYITGLPQKADELSSSGKIGAVKYDKFQKLYQDWKGFYQYVTQSWYVSDEDLNVAKKKRDDINMLLIPEETKFAQKYSTQAKGQTREETAKYEAETKSFLERHWLAITLATVGTGALVYLSGNVLTFLQVAGRATHAKALTRALHH